MGSFSSKAWVKVLAWITSAFIIVLNGKRVYDRTMEWIQGGAPMLVSILTIGAATAISSFLVYIIVLPLMRGQKGWEAD